MAEDHTLPVPPDADKPPKPEQTAVSDPFAIQSKMVEEEAALIAEAAKKPHPGIKASPIGLLDPNFPGILGNLPTFHPEHDGPVIDKPVNEHPQPEEQLPDLEAHPKEEELKDNENEHEEEDAAD